MNRNTLLVAALVASLSVNGPDTRAAADSEWRGSCGFASATDVVAGEGRHTGTIDIELVVFSQATPTDNPVSARATCYVTVNGYVAPCAVVGASGTASILGGGVVCYDSYNAADDVRLCIHIDYESNATPDTEQCGAAATVPVGDDVEVCGERVAGLVVRSRR